VTKPIARDPIYRRRGFDAEVIELCVRRYISYRLSYRDLVELMAHRGVAVSHATIMRWVIPYVPEFEKRWNRFARPVGKSWRVDETLAAVILRVAAAAASGNGVALAGRAQHESAQLLHSIFHGCRDRAKMDT